MSSAKLMKKTRLSKFESSEYELFTSISVLKIILSFLIQKIRSLENWEDWEADY